MYLYVYHCRYNTLDNEMILDIPLSELMRPGCLIVIWVTNKQKHDKFVMKELFPNHTIDFVARWYWLKVFILFSFFLSEYLSPYLVLKIIK